MVAQFAKVSLSIPDPPSNSDYKKIITAETKIKDSLKKNRKQKVTNQLLFLIASGAFVGHNGHSGNFWGRLRRGGGLLLDLGVARGLGGGALLNFDIDIAGGGLKPFDPLCFVGSLLGITNLRPR